MADLVLPQPGDRVLSLWQPWASLIALRVKRIETRGWSTSYRGPLWIHAAKRYPTFEDMRVVATNVDAWNAWGADGYVDEYGEMGTGPLGAIVARVDLTDVIPILSADDRLDDAWQPHVAPMRPGSDVLWHWQGPTENDVPSLGRPAWRHADVTDQAPLGDFTPGRFAWLVDDVLALDEPIPMRGRQQIWRIPDGVRP